MSLLKYVIAAAGGYYAATPAGRRQLKQLGQKAAELGRSPKVAEIEQRGRQIVGEAASAAVDKVRGTSANEPATSGATAVSGTATAGPAPFAAVDRAASDDLPTVQTGVLPPGPAPRAADEV